MTSTGTSRSQQHRGEAQHSATESLSLNPRSRRHREELAATQTLLERTGPIVTQTIGMTRALCDHYDPTIADEPTVLAIAEATAARGA